MINSDLFTCYASQAGVSCSDFQSAETQSLFQSLQVLLGTPPDGELKSSDLAAYQQIAAIHGLQQYLNVHDIASHVDEIMLQLGGSGVASKPPTWFWVAAAAGVLALGTVSYFVSTRSPARARA